MRLDPAGREDLKRYMTLAQVGLEIAAPAGIGVALDFYFRCVPWGTIVGVVLGFSGGLIHLIQLSNQSDDLPKPPTDTPGTGSLQEPKKP